jgi:Carboxylesterase family
MRGHRLFPMLFAWQLVHPACAGPPPPAPPLPPALACSAPTVRTSSGDVCGLEEDVTVWSATPARVRAYLGIPYAESPAGPDRWKPPVAYVARSGVLSATRFGPVCPQPALVASIEQTSRI